MSNNYLQELSENDVKTQNTWCSHPRPIVGQIVGPLTPQRLDL